MPFSSSFSFLDVRARALVAALALFALFAGTAPAPARADGAASTRNIVLGAAAAVAAVIVYNNIHHKQVAHDTVVGRTSNGGVVYGDGRVVYPNGNVLYTSNGNGRVCSYVSGYGEPCGARPVAYYPAHRYAYVDRDHDRNRARNRNWDRDRDGDHDRGRHYGERKHRGDGDRDRDDRRKHDRDDRHDRDRH